MSRTRQLLVLAAGLALVGGVVYLAYTSRPRPRPQPEQVAGLAWLPAEAGLVGSVNLAELRQQGWLLDVFRQATGEVKEAPDYRAFIEATGFDYSRDLDRLSVGVLGTSQQPLLTGVAEGRFARARMVDYARQQGAQLRRYQGLDIYEIPPTPSSSRRRPAGSPEAGPAGRGFAFAFLDDTHLAFASDTARVAMVVDCWLGKAPAVSSDEPRRAELERLATGQQAWAVDEPAKWKPPFFGDTPSGQPFEAVVAQMALGLRVNEQGVELAGEARCRQPGQAERLRDNLTVLTLLGRVTLSRQQNEGAQALAETLGNLTFMLQGDTVSAHVLIPRAQIATLLGVPPAATTAP